MSPKLKNDGLFKNNSIACGNNKKFATLAARAVFERLFFLQQQLIYDFLAGNNYPDSPHLQRGMKFATQISPLLNCNYKLGKTIVFNVKNVKRASSRERHGCHSQKCAGFQEVLWPLCLNYRGYCVLYEIRHPVY